MAATEDLNEREAWPRTVLQGFVCRDRRHGTGLSGCNLSSRGATVVLGFFFSFSLFFQYFMFFIRLEQCPC